MKLLSQQIQTDMYIKSVLMPKAKTGGLIFLLLLLWGMAQAQNDATTILQHTADVCSKVKTAHYQVSTTYKGLMKPDTAISQTTIWFEVLPRDTMLGAKMRLDGGLNTMVYNGKELFSISNKDQSQKLMSMMSDKNFRDLRDYDKTALNYFGAGNDFEVMLNEPQNRIYQNKGFKQNGIDCYMIAVALPKETRQEYNVISNDVTILIDKETGFPVSILEQKQIMFQNKMLQQFKRIEILNASFNSKLSDTLFKYTETKTPPDSITPFLKQGNAAPQFNYTALSGNTIDLKLLKGSPVIICFWNKENYDCMKTLSVVNGLQKKYAAYNLKVVCINVKNYNEQEQVKLLLQKRNITCENILTSDKTVLSNYNIISYPTTYLIDRSGLVALAVDGYSEYLRNTLERILLKMK